ncbi:MAG TPA: glycosyltransferase family 4 protein [Anaerolineales bacterium]
MRIGYLMQVGAPEVRHGPFSGPAIHVRQVIRELNRMGHSVRLLANQQGQTWKSNDLEAFEPVQVRRLEHGPLRWIEGGVRRVQTELKLPYLAMFDTLRFSSACLQELADCDLFYERMGWMGYGGWQAARRLRIPLVLEVNGDHLSELERYGMAPKGFQRRWSISATRHQIAYASHIVASGIGWRKRFIDRWGETPGKVTVVENGTELVERFERRDLRSFQDEAIPAGETRLVYVGGFQAWQGVTVLIKALAQVIAQGIPIQLVLVGDGPEREESEKLVQDLNLEGCVTFAGQLLPTQYAGYLSGADIGLSPYCGWSEFTGLKLLDYKAAGLGIIASGKDGQPSIIEHYRTGLIVPPCDETALAAAIALLSTDAALRKRLGRAARLDAEQLHSWGKTAENLYSIFQRSKAT